MTTNDESARPTGRTYTADEVRDLMRLAWLEGWSAPRVGPLSSVRDEGVARIFREYNASNGL